MGWPWLGIDWGGHGQCWTLARVNLSGLGMAWALLGHILGLSYAGIGMVWTWRELGCFAQDLGMV